MGKHEPTVMPSYSPLFPQLPYQYKNYKKISIYCRTDEEKLQAFLPEGFETDSSLFEVFLLKNDEIEGLDPYLEGGIVIPCRYEDRVGAHMAFEYVNSDDALCAGREIWGYPKKWADVEFVETEKSVSGKIIRRGKTIIEMELEFADVDVVAPKLFPRIQVKTIPSAEKNEADTNQIVVNDFANPIIHSQQKGKGKVSFEYSEHDPFASLQPLETVGGVYTIGDFTLTYGKIISGRK